MLALTCLPCTFSGKVVPQFWNATLTTWNAKEVPSYPHFNFHFVPTSRPAITTLKRYHKFSIECDRDGKPIFIGIQVAWEPLLEPWRWQCDVSHSQGAQSHQNSFAVHFKAEEVMNINFTLSLFQVSIWDSTSAFH